MYIYAYACTHVLIPSNRGHIVHVYTLATQVLTVKKGAKNRCRDKTQSDRYTSDI